jgi:hypothetical protein
MAYGSIAGRARTSARNPQAHAICDRCGGRYNHVDLQWQYDWAGATTINKRILVCRSCLDNLQPQLRSLVLPGDPPPIMNPRPELFSTAETNFRTTQGSTTDARTGIMVPDGDIRITQDDSNRVTQQTGFADGSLNEQPGTDPAAQTPPLETEPGLPYGNTTVPETGPI